MFERPQSVPRVLVPSPHKTAEPSNRASHLSQLPCFLGASLPSLFHSLEKPRGHSAAQDCPSRHLSLAAWGHSCGIKEWQSPRISLWHTSSRQWPRCRSPCSPPPPKDGPSPRASVASSTEHLGRLSCTSLGTFQQH